jgi:hypothetical protein
MVYTGYTGIYLYKKGLSFISNRQRRKEGTLRASGVGGTAGMYILVYKNNIGHIQAYTVTCDRYIFHAEAHFHDVCASYYTYPKNCMT